MSPREAEEGEAGGTGQDSARLCTLLAVAVGHVAQIGRWKPHLHRGRGNNRDTGLELDRVEDSLSVTHRGRDKNVLARHAQ